MTGALVALALVPLLAAPLPALLQRAFGVPPAVPAALAALLALALAALLAPAALAGHVELAGWAWVPALGLRYALRFDGLACLYALLITGIGAVVVLYARWYLPAAAQTGRFYGLLLLFMGVMLGVVLAEDLVLLCIYWELTSLVSFLLIGFDGTDPASRRGARLALLVTAAGGLALLGGVLLIGDVTGSYQLSDVLATGPLLRSQPLYLAALLLVLAGAFTKSAQWPLHVWLPPAMAAPTPVSAYLHSATMVKAGVFVVMRLYPVLGGTAAWFWLLCLTGAATLLFGAAVALGRHDMKALLAYSTISNLGLIMLLMGLGTPLAETAALFQLLNHALFKAALFMATGIVDHQTGTRDIRRLSGLARCMPHTAALATAAAAAMAGVPLLNGFLSKEMFFGETLAIEGRGVAGVVIPVVALLAAVCTVAGAIRFIHDVFFGAPMPVCDPPVREAPRALRVPIELLVLACLAVGLAPAYTVEPLLRAAAAAMLQAPPPPFSLALWHGLTLPLAMSAAALAGGALLYGAGRRRGLLEREHRAWLDGAALVHAALDELVAGARLLWQPLAAPRLAVSVLALLGSALAAAAFAGGGTTPFAWPLRASGTGPLLVGAAWLVATTAACLRWHRQRHRAVVALGAAGLGIVLAYAWFSAPDLALTQLLVELVTLLVLLRALAALPATVPSLAPAGRRVRDALVAGGAGLGAALVALAVQVPRGGGVSGYYTAHAPGAGGGRNVVNVILVDFRAFDTLGEITVLAIAALAVAALLRGQRDARPAGGWQGHGWDARTDHVQLTLVLRALAPLALGVAAWLFVRGHQAPGGGFVAGLVSAVALYLPSLGFGPNARPPWPAAHSRELLAAGLAIAVATGLGSLVAGYPFLTSASPTLALPLGAALQVASATLFDAGVYCVVVGATLALLAAPAPEPPQGARWS